MQMVDPLISVSLETLRDLLVGEIGLLSGVSDQVKQIDRDLQTMRSFLEDADKWSKRYDPASLHNWIIDLKNLSSEAENVLERYALEVKSRKKGKKLKKLKRYMCIFKECYSVHKVGKETAQIQTRLTELMQRLGSITGGEGSSNTDSTEKQELLTYAHEVEQLFVGMEEDMESLVSRVTDDQTSSTVTSICGMGGLGKTTLARKVYNHPRVQAAFESHAWVCATQKFQGQTVLREILKQLLQPEKKEGLNNMGQSELVIQLHSVLMQRKSLIIIDDIWNPEHWDYLSPAFPSNAKVLLTTRRENIVSPESVYKLGFLTEDESWDLLQKKALPRNINHAPALESELKSLEVIGRQITQKCGHLPLAVSVIGGLLRQKQTLAEWKEVDSNIDSYLRHGDGIGNNTRVKQVLDLSFDSLPYYLKPCFLYLGCFPEDEEVDVERLYHLWIAEGLISSQDKGKKETLRNVAERYLIELAFRCLVQVEKDEIFTSNKFTSCHLHDLMHDLCTSKAAEERFLMRIEHPYDVPPIGATPSRVAICADDDATINIQKLEGLRSFILFKKDNFSVPPRIHFHSDIIDFESSKRLKILVLEKCEFEGRKLPSEIGKLLHLRFLSLLESDVDELPSFVYDLPYLQTLDLRLFYPIKLPNLICKMKRLRHLFLNEIQVIGEQKLKLDGLVELDTLECENTEMICLTDIPKLTNLQNLKIYIKDMDSLSVVVHHMSNNPSKLRNTVLRVSDCDFSSNEGKDVFRKMLMSPSLISLTVQDCDISCGFPCYQQQMCENLVDLGLECSSIGGDVMETLGQYPVLKVLSLDGVLLNRQMICCPNNSFPELKFLNLLHMPNLKKWEVVESAMPHLSILNIIDCKDLEKIPDGLRYISTIEILCSFMPKQFNDRLRILDGHAGDDYPKVCRIPSVQLHDSDGRSDSQEDEETMCFAKSTLAIVSKVQSEERLSILPGLLCLDILH